MKTIEEMIKVMQAYKDGKEIESIGEYIKKWTVVTSPSWDWSNYDYRIKGESKYRPFKDIDELISFWDKKVSGVGFVRMECTMPTIWIKDKNNETIYCLIGFDKTNNQVCTYTNRYYDFIGCTTLDLLFNDFIFVDGKPCGVEE